MADARHARSGICESGTAVSGRVPYTLRATIGGTARPLILESFTLDDSLDGAPARATARVHGWTPRVGQELRLADDGATRYLFAGTILRRRARNQPGLPVIWNMEAVDYQFLLNAHALVFEDFEAVAVNTAVARILARYTDAAAGFRIGCTHAALGRITQRFDGARVTDAIARIATAAGAFWARDPRQAPRRVHGSAERGTTRKRSRIRRPRRGWTTRRGSSKPAPASSRKAADRRRPPSSPAGPRRSPSTT